MLDAISAVGTGIIADIKYHLEYADGITIFVRKRTTDRTNIVQFSYKLHARCLTICIPDDFKLKVDGTYGCYKRAFGAYGGAIEEQS